MRKVFSVILALSLVVAFSGLALAADNPLVTNEKGVWKDIVSHIPKDKYRNVDDLYKKWEEVLAGKSDAYLLDVRSHPEFDAFHIEGSSHIHSGHMYTIPKKIPNADAEIWVYCRTAHRAGYVAGMLYMYGYKNVYFVTKADDGTDGGVVGWVKRGYPVVNYFFGYATKEGIKYSKPPLKERKGKSFVREFENQRAE
ncbi:MAG: rhodanese-like domain-containing protein [Deltaproteobacteria bacterium]|nr:rhodanese-like domain-containing protein [Deltaproteobacteria bacterium]